MRTSVTKAAVSAGHEVRIIGGLWKRTPLPVADAAGLRPTPDRVRETVFNWLSHLVAEFGSVRGLDLFAGSGALGFELASRGAAQVTLIEANRVLVAALERVREKLGASSVQIIQGDALIVAQRFVEGSFDMVFVDPPYGSGLLAPALSAAARLVTAEGFIYAEAPQPLDERQLAALGLRETRGARAGGVYFYLLQRASL